MRRVENCNIPPPQKKKRWTLFFCDGVTQIATILHVYRRPKRRGTTSLIIYYALQQTQHKDFYYCSSFCFRNRNKTLLVYTRIEPTIITRHTYTQDPRQVYCLWETEKSSTRVCRWAHSAEISILMADYNLSIIGDAYISYKKAEIAWEQFSVLWLWNVDFWISKQGWWVEGERER